MNTPKIIINEVDCYRGNAWNIAKYATHSATQHQIMILKGGTEYHLNFRNKVADEDRGERIVFSKETTPEALNLLRRCINLQDGMMSEHCKSIEDFNEASEYNKPIKQRIKSILSEIYKIESLDIEEDRFIQHFLA